MLYERLFGMGWGFMPIVRTDGVQVKGCLWLAAILLILALIRLGIGLILGDVTLIRSMFALAGRVGTLLIAAAIAYVLISVFLKVLFK